jgi:hypothetical protein
MFFLRQNLIKTSTNHLYQSMKADIIIPEVENIAKNQEWSDDFMEKVWYAYLVNDSDFLMESVMVFLKHLEPSMAK